MEIGRVAGRFINNSIDSTKSHVVQDSFEKQLQSAIANKDEKKLKEACKEFESIMLNMMYKQMRAAIPKSDLIPSDPGRDIFESMLDEKLVEEASKGGGIGLADIMYKQLSRSLINQKPEKNTVSTLEYEVDISPDKGESPGE